MIRAMCTADRVPGRSAGARPGPGPRRAPRPAAPPATLATARRAAGPLAGFVDHVWVCAGGDAARTSLRPDGRIDLVLTRTASDVTIQVFGSVTAPTELPLEPGATYVGVQFRPGRSRHFLRPGAGELTDGCLPAHEVLPVELGHALDAEHPRDIVRTLEAALARHLVRVQPQPQRIDRIVDAMLAAGGNLRIVDLVDRCGLGRRQLERALVQAVGLSPKQFAATLRFDRAVRCLRAGMRPTDAAFEAGYADQSHMHRAFQRYAGLTPQGCVRAEVAFFQDAKAWPDDDGPYHA